MRIIDPPLSLYHGTKFEHVSAILASGIKNVGSAWGQGELGAGFYTATQVAGGAAYLEGPGGVIEFEVTKQLKGADVTPPALFDWSGTGRLDEITRLCTGYDYLVSSTDIPVSQIKHDPCQASCVGSSCHATRRASRRCGPRTRGPEDEP